MALGAQFDDALAAARGGVGWGLAALYRDLQPALLRYLSGQEPAEADDLASETWIDVAAGLTRFRGGEADLRRWVFTIARRRLCDLRRRRGRRGAAPLPPETLERPTGPGYPGDPEATVVESISASAAVARIKRLLPAAQAEVVLLRVVGGLSVEDVAAIVGKRPGTIRVIQHRALRRLAAALSDDTVTAASAWAMY